VENRLTFAPGAALPKQRPTRWPRPQEKDHRTMSVTLYHNPRCSKSRATLALLQEKGIEPTIVEYLKTPPTVAELTAVLAKLGMTPKELVRSKEAKEAGLNLEAADQDLIAAMVANPSVIERPVVITQTQARIGRPPESVLDILDL
jgi:arsenate reductase